MKKKTFSGLPNWVAGALLLCALTAGANADLTMYTDNLVNGFQDWSWASRSLTNTTTTHSGTNSIYVTGSQGQGISFHSGVNINTTIYTNFTFWANGGTSGGQQLNVYLELSSGALPPVNAGTLTANTWKQYSVSLSSLGVANKTNLVRLNITLNGGTIAPYYLDDIALGAAPAPVIANIGVNSTNVLRTADARWFGVNTATWDGLLSSSPTIPLLKEMGTLTLRWPGGSTSDQYHWASDLSGNSTFMHVATNIGANVFITVNYGSGTSNEAASWVKYANITNHCGFKYWEVGNENYGTWETDNHTVKNDPYTYATNFKNYYALMKAADPTGNIKIGAVVVTGESSSINNSNHFAVNPRTLATNYGWTPVMLSTMKSLGVTPDFVIYHFYPQYTAANWMPNVSQSDNLLLQVAANWAGDAADIRQQLTDYLSTTNSTNVEIVCTENNSEAGVMGRQSTSIVNALYLADSTSQLMKTEFNSYIWWDLRNGTDTTGIIYDSSIYGWRTNGDYGVISSSNTRYPTFYAAKLLQYFVRPGDSILKGSSDTLYLGSYAARKADGALAMLVINKTPTNFINTRVSLTNFSPYPVATVRTFGIPQDQATQSNILTAGIQDIYTNTMTVASVFTNSFAPYSMTLLTIPPAASQLSIVSATGNSIVLQIQGQSGVPYVLQSCTNLTNGAWTMVSTNLMVSNSMNLTNAVSPQTSATFWRSVWLP